MSAEQEQQIVFIEERRRFNRRIAYFLMGLVVLLVVVSAGLLFSANVATTAQQTAVAGQNLANATLTPIPLTLTPSARILQSGQTQIAAVPPSLTEVAQQIAEGEARIVSIEHAVQANAVLQASGNAETATLLAIRGLKSAYSPEADAALVQALDRLYTRQSFIGHTSGVNSEVFSPDGESILTGSGGFSASSDDTARLWDTDYRDFIAYACSRVFCDLNEYERLLY